MGQAGRHANGSCHEELRSNALRLAGDNPEGTALASATSQMFMLWLAGRQQRAQHEPHRERATCAQAWGAHRPRQVAAAAHRARPPHRAAGGPARRRGREGWRRQSAVHRQRWQPRSGACRRGRAARKGPLPGGAAVAPGLRARAHVSPEPSRCLIFADPLNDKDTGEASSAPAWRALSSACTAACVCASSGRASHPPPAPLEACAALATANTPAAVCLTAERTSISPAPGGLGPCAPPATQASAGAKQAGTSITAGASPCLSPLAPMHSLLLVAGGEAPLLCIACAGSFASVWNAVGHSPAAMSPGSRGVTCQAQHFALLTHTRVRPPQHTCWCACRGACAVAAHHGSGAGCEPPRSRARCACAGRAGSRG